MLLPYRNYRANCPLYSKLLCDMGPASFDDLDRCNSRDLHKDKQTFGTQTKNGSLYDCGRDGIHPNTLHTSTFIIHFNKCNFLGGQTGQALTNRLKDSQVLSV